MPIANADVVAVFTEIADLLEIEDANPFRVRAYRNAARMLAELGRDVRGMVDHPDELDALPGIGPDLAGKIVEVARTGSCALLERLRGELPAAITGLLKIPGMGPRRVRTLHRELGIQTLAQLHQAAVQGRVRRVPGFGEKSEQRILAATRGMLQPERRYRRADVEPVARALLADLGATAGVHQALAAGSLRRGCETVGDLDLLVTADDPRPVMDSLRAARDVARVLESGVTRCSVVLRSGLQVDLRAVAPVSFGAAALYFTGSKAHNIALRKLAQEQGLKLNEYGLYRARRRIAGDAEAAVYAALGLSFIEPQLREDRGEIDAARHGALPALVRLADLRGDLHAHTRDSDGLDDLHGMAEAARALGLQYLALTDHSKHAGIGRGLDADGLARQMDRIDEANATLRGIVLLKGVEVDILEDGTLDLPDAVLGRLDLVVGAIHGGFDLSRERQTERLLRAMDRPFFSLLAHPSARLINERPPCDVDLARVIGKARERGCFLELNADPARLDLTDLACRMAKDAGVLVSIDSDAHSRLQFGNLRFGVDQARRGWLCAADVLNTRPPGPLRALLDATMGRAAAAAGGRSAAPV